MVDDEIVRTLYAASPEDFLGRRAELAAQAKAGGDAEAARAIGKLRKPTVAAWIVNACVHADDTVTSRIGELGDALRSAQQDLDATRMRELSAQRRALVTELTRAALDHAGRGGSAAVHDEVRATFDAAVADPEVAARLGRLPRAESFSGFGFDAAAGPPALTLVRGGRSEEKKKQSARGATRPPGPTKGSPTRTPDARPTTPDPGPSAAVVTADKAVEEAEAAVSGTRDAQQDAAGRVRAAEQAVAQAKDALAAARAEHEGLRDAHRAALADRREARRALDRARKGR